MTEERVEKETCLKDMGNPDKRENANERTLALLLISRLAIVSTGWKTSSSATPSEQYVRYMRAQSSGETHPMRQTQARARCPTPS